MLGPARSKVENFLKIRSFGIDTLLKVGGSASNTPGLGQNPTDDRKAWVLGVVVFLNAKGPQGCPQKI